MYTEAICEADETLAANKLVRAETAELRASTIALLIKYRHHRFFYVSGGSDAGNDDAVRRLLRDFLSGPERPKSFAGSSATIPPAFHRSRFART